MKLCKLKLKNLNSFRSEIELDFEQSPLDNASLVAITGPTGAGKTTLLDAICVALYGKTPRLTGIGSQNPSHLISHGETDSHAELHFVANGLRYLTEWNIRHGNSPKGQLRSVENAELITDRLSSQGKSLGSSENTISDEIQAILGLDFDAFKRSVMLAQGEFAAFLKAKDEERRTILEATAGVDIYDRLKDALNQKVREIESIHQDVAQRLNGIPAVNPEQITTSESHLKDLERDADALDTNRRQIQSDKQREMERTRLSAELHAAEERNEELSNRQMEITALKTELEQADRANHLRAEKQAFDAAKLELDTAETALHQTEIEFANAQRQFDTTRADFDEKDTVYRAALVPYNQTANNYNTARLDVTQATERFTRAAELEAGLLALAGQIDSLSTKLTEYNERYTALAAEVNTIEAFLVDNQLPPDRQERLTSAYAILAEHRLKEQQLTNESEEKVRRTSEVSRLSTGLAQLDKEREELAAQQEVSAILLADVDATLTELQEQGTLEEWRMRRQRAEQARSVAQRYETTQEQLRQSENALQGDLDQIGTLDDQLEKISNQLTPQLRVCQEADEAVERWEAARESALLVNPINQLRLHLQAGEPCPVCGATEHPCRDNVEPEGRERLQNAENALVKAKDAAETAHEHRTTLEREQIRINQNRINLTDQVETHREETHRLRSEIQSITIQWRKVYPNAVVSSDWIEQQIQEANTAIESLQEAHDSRTRASHDCHTIAQELENFEQSLERERSLLDDAQQNLQKITNVVEGLTVNIGNIETRLRDLLPADLRSLGLEAAVNQFDDKIRTVAAHEQELKTKQTQLQLDSTDIRTLQQELETAEERRNELQTEIEAYRNEGNGFLDAAREKTGGFSTVDEIDTATKKLEEALHAKANLREEAEGVLQGTQTAFTEARTKYSHHQSRRTECSQKFETARTDYLEKLRTAGFNSVEAHNSAYREEDSRKELAETITAYTDEKQGLEVNTARLRAIFAENPFAPEVLAAIQASEQEIEKEIAEKQQEIGAHRTEINHLKEALAQRIAINAEMQQSGHELERWQRLQNTIPANNLRDFALDIMFKQMGRLANTQLEYLTLERYRLKVKGIGKLTIVDRWNANEERPVETLSGGESFLTSLALALALSELSRGRSQIHSLFLDEGFGTLDSETLDVAIAALEGLQMQGRSIFLISHIGELTRRIPVRIAVQKMGNGSSQVQVHG